MIDSAVQRRAAGDALPRRVFYKDFAALVAGSIVVAPYQRTARKLKQATASNLRARRH
jgi:hypothetical protein